MTYSLEISLAALSKLQSIVECQKADQELLARVLTDAVEHFERNRKIPARRTDVKLFTPPPVAGFHRVPVLEPIADKPEPISSAPAQVPDDVIVDACKAITEKLAKVHKLMDEPKKPEEEEEEEACKIKDAGFREWEISKTGKVVEKETSINQKPRNDGLMTGGMLKPCVKCDKVKPSRWMEREAKKPYAYSGWCLNCSFQRDQIDEPKNKDGTPRKQMCPAPKQGVEF